MQIPLQTKQFSKTTISDRIRVPKQRFEYPFSETPVFQMGCDDGTVDDLNTDRNKKESLSFTTAFKALSRGGFFPIRSIILTWYVTLDF